MSDTRLLAPRTACRLCGDDRHLRRVGPERRLRLGQWLVRCGACGGLWLDPDMSPAALDTFYRHQYRREFPIRACVRPDEAFVFGMRIREIGLRRAQALAPLVPPGGRVLELGAGHGGFIGRLHALRPDVALVAVEPDETIRAAALDGAPVAFVIEKDLDGGEAFDLIVLFHVLEHLADPVATLARMGRRLRPGGRLVIEVPEAFPPGSGWHEVHSAHLSYFTPAALRRTLCRAGLTPVEPAAGRAITVGSLWQEAVADGPPPAPGHADDAEIAALDRAVDAALARPAKPLYALLRRGMAALVGIERIGGLARWRHGPGQDRSLASPDRAFFLGVPVDLLTGAQILARLHDAMAGTGPRQRVADINVAKLVAMQDDAGFRLSVAAADLVAADGMGVVWAARWLGVPVPERVSGIDLLHRVMALCAEQGFRPFVLGAKADVLERALARLCTSLPGLRLAGSHHGYFRPEDEDDLMDMVRHSGADCLVVALSTPRQDHILERFHAATGVAVSFGVGGSLDVISGDLRRAPRWMQRAGLEWLFRLMQEPRRLGGRYLSTNLRLALLLARTLPALWLTRR